MHVAHTLQSLIYHGGSTVGKLPPPNNQYVVLNVILRNSQLTPETISGDLYKSQTF